MASTPPNWEYLVEEKEKYCKPLNGKFFCSGNKKIKFFKKYWLGADWWGIGPDRDQDLCMVVARNFRSPKKIIQKVFSPSGPLSSISGQWLQFGPGAAWGRLFRTPYYYRGPRTRIAQAFVGDWIRVNNSVLFFLQNSKTMQLCPCCDLCCTLRLQGLFFLIFEGVLELTMFWGGCPLFIWEVVENVLSVFCNEWEWASCIKTK